MDFSAYVNAQTNLKRNEDLFKYMVTGFAIGAVTAPSTYFLLTRFTTLDYRVAKVISVFTGATSGFFAGHVQQKFIKGKFYDTYDIFNTGMGSTLPAISFSIILGNKFCPYPSLRVMKNMGVIPLKEYREIKRLGRDAVIEKLNELERMEEEYNPPLEEIIKEE